MITSFIGEFMFHPAPLEFSGNTCSHNCCYCFANIRKSGRVCDLKGIIKQVNKKEIKTYADALLQEGYPICMSNKSDPFSKTNYLSTIALGREFTKLRNGIFIQTKGGYGIDEFIHAAGNKKDMVWYITITTLDEKISRRIEPNAPTPEERFLLAEKLKSLGYHVILAINPILEEWIAISDVVKFIEKARSIGVNDIVTEALHLNKREVESFSEIRKSTFTESEISYAVEKKTFQNYVKQVIPVLIGNGVNVAKLGMPYKTELFNGIRNVFGHIFPNQHDIINYAHKNGTGQYTFDQFFNVSVDNKPFFERKIKEINKYLLKSNIHAWATDDDAKQCFTLKDVMRKQWNDSQYKQSMRRNQAFRTIVDNELRPIKDSNGNIVLYFDYGVYPTERIINENKLKS